MPNDWKRLQSNSEVMKTIPENKFYSSNFHCKQKLWRFNKNYDKNCQPINTNLFLEHEVKLN